MSQIKVRGPIGEALPDIRIRIAEQGQDSDSAFFDVSTDDAGNTGWPVPYFPERPYTLWVNTSDVKPAYQPLAVDALNGDDMTITLLRAPLKRVWVEGHDLRTEDGRWFMKGVTDFLLYKRFLDGEDIRPLLAERSAMGANCVRVIGMVSSFSHWYPQEYGDRYYDELPNFFALCSYYGLYVYFTVFADTQIVMPGQATQVAHYNKVLVALRQSSNTLGELVNEPYAHSNATDNPNAFPEPTGVAFSGGSYNDKLGNELRPVPGWERMHDFHSPRDGHNAEGFKYCADLVATAHPEYRYRGKALLQGEPQKFADPSDPTKGGSTLSNPAQARMMAGSARGTCCGVVFHTPGGVFSRMWNEVEKACGREWFAELA